MSPMFPRAYEPNTHCRFEFRGNIRERIQLSFKEFTLPSEADGDDCELSDTLQVCVTLDLIIFYGMFNHNTSPHINIFTHTRF